MKSKSPFVIALSLVAAVVANALAAETLIPAEADGWKYQDQVARADGNWQATDYADAHWSEGRALLGYGDRDIRTELSFGGNPQNKRRVAFFRRRFGGSRRFRHYFGRICCDDGAVVYVNGKEVHRYNMPDGTVTSNTQALKAVGADASAERKRHPFFVEQQLIQDGENVVAVSVHQANPTSSDLAFDLELVGLETESELKQARYEVDQHDQAEPTHATNVGVSPVFHFNLKPR